jgi:alpha-beta hydrolase superfamily lysophospholipase
MNPYVADLAAPKSRSIIERSFRTHDDIELYFRCWPAAGTGRKGAVLLFHRGHEHSGRMAHLVDELDLPEFAFYAWDARGHGRSQGERGAAPSFVAVVRDVDEFVRHLAQSEGLALEEMAVVAQSVGAVAVAAWAHDYAPAIRAMVLASPAFAVRLYVPFALPGLRLLHRLRGDFVVNSRQGTAPHARSSASPPLSRTGSLRGRSRSACCSACTRQRNAWSATRAPSPSPPSC